MTHVDCTLKKLPSKYNEEIFQVIENNFGQDRTINLGNIVQNTSAIDFGAFEDPFDLVSHGIGTLEELNDISDDISIEGNKQSTVKKKLYKLARLKSTLIESNKMIIHNLDMAEEGHTECYESTEETQMERHK
eukprot:Gb_33372 [translate_table: standard]